MPLQFRAQHVRCARLQTQLRKSGQSLSVLHSPAQVTATQAPFWHCSRVVHCLQVPPAEPQAWFVFPVAQAPLAAQQPFGQLSAVQTHCPLFWSQSEPDGQVNAHTPPQPSGPHRWLGQLGTQQSPNELHSVAFVGQQAPLQQ